MVKPGGLVAIGTKLDPSLTRSDSFIGSVIGKPETLPENQINAKCLIVWVNIFRHSYLYATISINNKIVRYVRILSFFTFRLQY